MALDTLIIFHNFTGPYIPIPHLLSYFFPSIAAIYCFHCFLFLVVELASAFQTRNSFGFNTSSLISKVIYYWALSSTFFEEGNPLYLFSKR